MLLTSSTVKIARDLQRAASDRFADHGGRQHGVVEHDGQGSSDIFRGDMAEAARAAPVETERHDRLLRGRIESRQDHAHIVAVHGRFLHQQIGYLVLEAVEHLGLRGHLPFAAPASGVIERSTRRNATWRLWVSIAAMRSGSLTPGTRRERGPPRRIAGRPAGCRRAQQFHDRRHRIQHQIVQAIGESGVRRREPEQSIAGIGDGDAARAFRRRRKLGSRPGRGPWRSAILISTIPSRMARPENGILPSRTMR